MLAEGISEHRGFREEGRVDSRGSASGGSEATAHRASNHLRSTETKKTRREPGLSAFDGVPASAREHERPIGPARVGAGDADTAEVRHQHVGVVPGGALPLRDHALDRADAGAEVLGRLAADAEDRNGSSQRSSQRMWPDTRASWSRTR